MPTITPCASLPYPNPGDSPDIQAHFRDLAVAIDNALCDISAAPIGTITTWYEGNGTSSLPPGKLECNGASFSAITYPALSAHLGGTLLPDLRGKFLRHRDSTGGLFPGRNQEGGFNDSIVVQHTHTQNSHGHGGNPHSHDITVNSDSHSHGPLNSTTTTETFISRLAATDATGGTQLSLQTGAGFRVDYAVATTASDSHTHTASSFIQTASVASTTAVNNNSGQSGANRNIPPFANVLFLIQAS